MCSTDAAGTGWPEEMVRWWTERRRSGEVVWNTVLSAQPAQRVPFPDWLSPTLVEGLERLGIASPYIHQATCWERIAARENVVVATPTASGKTLCYNVPVLERLRRDPRSRALYLFPTKALAHDQGGAVFELAEAVGRPARVAFYDGDTSAEERRVARAEADVIITNPDMLHTGILPHHTAWTTFLSGLQTVVVDELHSYRGVFGSHVANVLRRLDRVLRFHGARPTFVAASATIRNPRELAEALVGQPFTLISRSGAPAGERSFAIYNPGLVDPERGVRRSVLQEAAELAADLVAAGKTTLVFCRSRQGVELTLRYLKERLAGRGRDPDRVRGYRGGYLPSLRREIEGALKNGHLDAVVATNALELGIDVGFLDAVVLAGYPGTVASLLQRAGRAGRRNTPSLAVLVTSADPLDQFLAREPKYVVGTSPERALVQPNNVEVLLNHLRCAAFELPFSTSDAWGDLSAEDTGAALACLAEEGDLSLSKDRYFYVGEGYPAALVSLRSVSCERVVVVDQESGEPMAEADPRAARLELHAHAVYQHEGRTYLVEALDLEERRALVREMEPVYHTVAIRHSDIEVVGERERRRLAAGTVFWGDVRVTERVTGFKKVRFHTHENLGYGEVELPPLSMETESLWLVPGAELWEGAVARIGAPLVAASLEGLGHALHQVAALRLMCDPRDLALAIQVVAEEGGDASFALMGLFLYDVHMGGVGLAEKAYQELVAILIDAARLVHGCGCPRGCPSCIGPRDGRDDPVKETVTSFARALADDLGAGRP